MKTLFENQRFRFLLPEGNPTLLLFEWKDDNQGLKWEDFQSACHLFAGFAWEHRALRLLVDTRNFTFPLPPEFPAWRETELNPRYYSLGVEKFAYLVSTESLHRVSDVPGESGRFETRYFDDFTTACLWLRQTL